MFRILNSILGCFLTISHFFCSASLHFPLAFFKFYFSLSFRFLFFSLFFPLIIYLLFHAVSHTLFVNHLWEAFKNNNFLSLFTVKRLLFLYQYSHRNSCISMTTQKLWGSLLAVFLVWPAVYKLHKRKCGNDSSWMCIFHMRFSRHCISWSTVCFVQSSGVSVFWLDLGVLVNDSIFVTFFCIPSSV